MSFVLQGFKSDTLAADMTDSATSATLTTGSFGTPAGAQMLVVDYDIPAKREIIKCEIDGTAVTSITRAQDGTAGVAHSSGAKVIMAFVPSHYKDHEDRVAAVEAAWTAWTPTVVGFSGTPTVAARYKKIGKTVFCRLRVDGTSNATSFTVTLPLKHNVNTSIYAVGRTQDNTTGFDWGFFIIEANATTTTACQIYRAVNTATWTNVNTKGYHGIFFYETE